MSIPKRLRRAGLVITAGLVLQLVSLGFLHPLAFVMFVVVELP